MPQIIVNRGVRTVAAAAREFLRVGDSGTFGSREISVSIASAYFNHDGWWQIADALESMGHVRLLLGAIPSNPPSDMADFADQDVQSLWKDLPDSDQITVLQLLLNWLRDGTSAGSVEVRRMNGARFLHGKAFITAPIAYDQMERGQPIGVLLGSANLTLAGMTTNSELCVSLSEPDIAADAMEWFEDLWNQADEFSQGLIDHYQTHSETCSPWLLYLRVLWEMYGKDIESEADSIQHSVQHGLAKFQAIGVARATQILERHSGVIIADEVGLGKTYIAGELIEQENRQGRRVLVLAPKALLPMWREFISTKQFRRGSVELVSHSQLSPTQKHPGRKAKDIPLTFSGMKKRDTFVIDEAHNFRNPRAARSGALRELVSVEGKRVVCLTATPVNNSVHDLYWLMRYYVRNGMQFSRWTEGRSLLAHFREAERRSSSGYDPGFMFELLDEAIIRRTRKFVQGHPDESIRGKPIQFPQTVARRIDYDMDAVMPGCFQEVYDALSPSEKTPPDRRLTLAAYRPAAYAIDEDSIPGVSAIRQHEAQINGLLRSGMLKRFESSPAAFASTCERMSSRCTKFLEAMRRGVIKTTDTVQDSESDDDAPLRLGKNDTILLLSQCDAQQLRADVEHDRDLLAGFAARARDVRPQNDPNLTALLDRISEIASEAESVRGDNRHRRDCRKIILFSAFKDTVEWVSEWLRVAIREASAISHLSEYADEMTGEPRITTLTGADKDGDDVITGFAPRTAGGDEDLYDILVCTDVLAEGVNLQQARHVINYDLPWNPMRLVQRHGRIDRIGSTHDTVYVHSVFPDRHLDQVLLLEATLHRKMREVLATVGTAEVLPGYGDRDAVFAGQHDEIRKLVEEDASLFERGGTERSAESGDDFRQTLRDASDKLIKQRVLGLPPAAGTVKQARNTAEQGFVFCAKAIGRDEPFLRHVAPHRQWAVSSETLRCLEALRCSEGDEASETTTDGCLSDAYHAWQLAKENIIQTEQETAAAEAEPGLKPIQREAIRALRHAQGTFHEPDGVEDALEALSQEIDTAAVNTLKRRLNHKNASQDAAAIISAVQAAGLSARGTLREHQPLNADDLCIVCWAAITGYEPSDVRPELVQETTVGLDEQSAQTRETGHGSISTKNHIEIDEPVRWPWESADWEWPPALTGN